MNAYLPLITAIDKDIEPMPVVISFLALQSSKNLFLENILPCKGLLDILVFRVAKNPKCLLTHIQRIYCCYQAQLGEELYGALVDLLIVLNKSGLAISRRMVSGAKSQLNEVQLKNLVRYLKDVNSDSSLLSGNQYSLFHKGMVGTNQLIVHIEEKHQEIIDPLALARDFIEYSQIPEAQSVLEAAILEHPDRLELHEELLNLYKSTRNPRDFNRMYIELQDSGADVPDIWKLANAFFDDLSQHG